MPQLSIEGDFGSYLIIFGNELDHKGRVNIGFAVKTNAAIRAEQAKKALKPLDIKEAVRIVLDSENAEAAELNLAAFISPPRTENATAESPLVIAQRRYDTGRFRFVPPQDWDIDIENAFGESVVLVPGQHYTPYAALQLEKKIRGWMESEGILVRKDSISDLIRRGQFFRSGTNSSAFRKWKATTESVLQRAANNGTSERSAEKLGVLSEIYNRLAAASA